MRPKRYPYNKKPADLQTLEMMSFTGTVQETVGSEVVKLVKMSIRRGRGTEDDPGRLVEQYFDFNHQLIFEVDPWREYHHILTRLRGS